MNEMKKLLELTGFSTKKELNESLFDQIVLIGRSDKAKEVNTDMILSVFIALAGGLYLKDWRRYVNSEILKELGVETNLDQLFNETSMHYLLLSDKGFLYKTDGPVNGLNESILFNFIEDVVMKTDLRAKLKIELEKIIKNKKKVEVCVD
ncbi:hypothetical protein [Bacillus cereus]|uniref:hypothetical protein n=1 Tax=Bacillus cereus TaxID=1396 RepID=UPI000B4C071F|nr:hypothetical protein [Bacillus cereus]